ncbi:hypothetical protein D1012_09765 [Pseudotabrizicola alkalilacus]|uniref:Uncharacterized protein n=1 Tax=Pseudotabrizicola alkalilacus TaxID=2305252 RepID=A0A411Z376_9RHOB|nr:hypothetical protein D1012_09765 [Pseudotabrizicola alkalilacus]
MNVEMLTAVVVFGSLLGIALVGLTLSNREAERLADRLHRRDRMASGESVRADKDKFPPIPS